MLCPSNGLLEINRIVMGYLFALTAEQVESFEKEGYLVVADAVPRSRTDAHIEEIWRVLTSLPRQPGWEIVVPDGVDVKGAIPPKVLKDWKKKWVPHAQFGAPCEPPFFHLENSWRNRQDPRLYYIYAQLLRRFDLWVGINRMSVKLPGHGEKEFLHWDDDPWHWEDAGNEGLIQGMLFLEDGCFYGIPGTHTLEFGKKFRAAYPHLAPGSKNNASKNNTSKNNGSKNNGSKNDASKGDVTAKARAKVGIDPKKDPLNLHAQSINIHVRKGELLIWNSRMLHEARPNESDGLRYAQYLGYRPAGSMEKLRNPETGQSEQDDRFRSFMTGKHPFYYPSGDPVQYVPLKWKNFPKQAEHHQTRLLPPQNTQTRVIKTGPKKGQCVPFMYEPDPVNYKPPKLTLLGKRLLGSADWPGHGNDQKIGAKSSVASSHQDDLTDDGASDDSASDYSDDDNVPLAVVYKKRKIQHQQ